MTQHYGPEHPERTYVAHAYAERGVDLGEVVMNYAVAGVEPAPALLLIPGQTESWWGYEAAMARLEADFRIYAVDLRGQGRSSRTPGRYTLDTMGADLVRFIQRVVGRPCIVAGLSSGGILAAWLSAYAPPDLVRAAYLEDAPLFSSEVAPACGFGIRQGYGDMFLLMSRFLGDQWCVGDWAGMVAAAPAALPAWMAPFLPRGDEPPQSLKEYDPEWARAFWSGTASLNCEHRRMLERVRVPVLFTHHFRRIDEETGVLQGAVADVQVAYARKLIEAAGQPFDYRSFPQMGHSLHGQDPKLYADTLREWALGLGV